MTWYAFTPDGQVHKSVEIPGRYEHHDSTLLYTSGQRTWWRMDFTPVLLNDVPKEYQLQLLLLT